MRTLALLLALAPSLALADEIDLSRSGGRDSSRIPSIVVRLEGGNEFAPFGFMGGCLSWMTDPNNELELGGGGGFPGLQLGLAGRHLFGEGGQFFLAELFLSGNTKVNRGVDKNSAQINAAAANANSSLWTGLGFGFELRRDFYSASLAGDIIFTTASFTPHWSIHGGVGFGF